jgi:hypothetical protein
LTKQSSSKTKKFLSSGDANDRRQRVRQRANETKQQDRQQHYCGNKAGVDDSVLRLARHQTCRKELFPRCAFFAITLGAERASVLHGCFSSSRMWFAMVSMKICVT